MGLGDMIAQRMRNDTAAGADFMPGLGAAIGGEEAGRDIGRGNYLSGGLGLAMSMVPGGKIGGNVAEGGVKQVVKKADDVLPIVDDYRGMHTAPRRHADNARLDDLTVLYPDDVYGPNAAQYYGHSGGNDPVDRESARLLRQFRGKPDAEVTIYRAVPKNAPDTINAGDWVTINPSYARTHGEGPLQGDYKVISRKARAKDLFTDANSIHEFGFDPE
jgi:hypothetical protein